MLPDRVSNPGPLTYESGALPIALRGPACPLSRTELKMNTIPSGSGTFIWQNIWGNNLPTKAFFAFVKQTAVTCDYLTNPFTFLNIAEEMALYVNGESVPTRPMKMDVGKNKNMVTPFVNLFEVAEKWNKDAGLQISRAMFYQGFAVYAFSITPKRSRRGIY